MIPTTYKWIAGAVALIAYTYLWFWLGSLPTKLKAETAAVKVEQAQVAQESKQLTTNNQAEAVHDTDLQTINLTVVRTPIVLHAGNCPVQVSTPTTGEHPASGAADPRPGVDIRPAVEAFERKYETVLADCRRFAAEWPR